MKSSRLGSGWLLVIVFSGFALIHSLAPFAVADEPPVLGGNYLSAQFPEWPPLPANIFGLPQAEITNGWFLLNDLNVNYSELELQAALLNRLQSLTEEGPPFPGGGGGEEQPPGNNPSSALGGRAFVGSCTGHLLPPVYQVTNLVLSIAGATSGDQYDLFTTPNINVTNWTYLGRWTNAAASWTVNNPPTNESYYAVACIDDADGEGLPDVYEAFATHTDPNDPDTDYDGRNDYEELAESTLPLDNTSFTATRLGWFRFNDASLAGERGQLPLATNNLQSVEAWITKGAQLTNSAAVLKYRTVEADGKANINLRSGSVRFWFKPQWNTGSGNAPANGARLLEVGQPGGDGWWSVYLDASGSSVVFVSQKNGASVVTNMTAGVNFTSNRWCQLVLTYTNGAVEFYTNGVLCASNSANVPYPGLNVRSNGFTLGSDGGAGSQAKGVFEDLETFNHPLSANDILENFQLTQPPILIPRLQMWLSADKGVTLVAPNKVRLWNDQSGNSNFAFQESDPARPILVDAGIGGKPAMYFPGTNSISFSITNSLFTGVSEAEAFVVLQAQTNTPSSFRSLWLMGVNSYYQSPDGNLRDSFGAGTPVDTGFPAQRVDQAHVFGVSAASNEWTLRINGVVHFTRNENTVTFSASPKLGDGGSGQSFQGFIAEVLIYSRRLTEIERLAVGAYLGQRYNLTTNPPTAPTNLIAFAVSTNQLSLSWSGPLSNTNISFLVQRRTANSGFSTVAVVPNALSYLDAGLAANTTYSYRVKAVDPAGESPYSGEINLGTLSSGISMPVDALTIWLKADAGHGGSPVNCWADQTTNNYSAFYKYNGTPRAPSWSATEMNGKPAMSFYGTNSYALLKFTTGWTQGEVFVVLKSLGVASNQFSALWLMSPVSLASWHPDPAGSLWENFGRTDGNTDTGVPPGFDLTQAHLYRVAAASNSFTTWLNNGVHYFNSVNTVGFSDTPTFGSGANGSMFRGHISEAMFFSRVLSSEERNAVAVNYLRQRYGLW